MHMQLGGGTSQPQMSEIIEELNDFGMELEKAEYHPIAKFVLQDIEKWDKEQMLIGHSEKLAVVFGLLNNTTHGSASQVRELNNSATEQHKANLCSRASMGARHHIPTLSLGCFVIIMC